MITDLLIAIASLFLDESDYGKQRPFTVESYLQSREGRNAEVAYGDEMNRLGWRG